MGFDPTSLGLSLGGGLLSSIFGGGAPELPPELKRLFHYLMGISKDELAYSNGIPGSDPQELAALAQAKGLAGGDFIGLRDRLFSSLNSTTDPVGAPGGDPRTNPTFNLVDRFNTNEAATMSNIDMQSLLQSLMARRQAKYGAAQIASGAGGAAHSYYQPNADLGSIFGQLAQNWGRSQGGGSGGGGGWPTGSSSGGGGNVPQPAGNANSLFGNSGMETDTPWMDAGNRPFGLQWG